MNLKEGWKEIRVKGDGGGGDGGWQRGRKTRLLRKKVR